MDAKEIAKRALIRSVCNPAILASAVLLSISSCQVYRVGKRVSLSIDRINSKTGILARAEGIEQKTFATLKNIDDLTGQLNDAAGDWSDASKQESQNILGITKHADNTLSGVDDTIGTASDQIAQLEPILRDADTAVKQVNTDLQTANTTIASAQPLIDQSKVAVTDLDKILKDKAVGETMANVNRLTLASANTMEQWDGISTNFNKMSARVEKDFDSPKPWYTKIGPYGGDLLRGVCLLSQKC
jgi:chromosome segregation ATPase